MSVSRKVWIEISPDEWRALRGVAMGRGMTAARLLGDLARVELASSAGPVDGNTGRTTTVRDGLAVTDEAGVVVAVDLVDPRGVAMLEQHDFPREKSVTERDAASSPASRSATFELSSNCTNAHLHWKLSRGETCRFCGGTVA